MSTTAGKLRLESCADAPDDRGLDRNRYAHLSVEELLDLIGSLQTDLASWGYAALNSGLTRDQESGQALLDDLNAAHAEMQVRQIMSLLWPSQD